MIYSLHPLHGGDQFYLFIYLFLEHLGKLGGGFDSSREWSPLVLECDLS